MSSNPFISGVNNFHNSIVNSGSLPQDSFVDLPLTQSGTMGATKGHGAIQLKRKPISIDVKDVLKKVRIVSDSARGLKVMLYNAMLEKFAELAYDIKNAMRIDTGIMAASWGIYDKRYIVGNLKDISRFGRRKIAYNPVNSNSIAKSSSVWFAKVDLRRNTPIIFQQGTLVDWLRFNEYLHGDKSGNIFFIEDTFVSYMPKINTAIRKVGNEYIKIMKSSRLKRKFIPPRKLDYRNLNQMRSIGEKV